MDFLGVAGIVIGLFIAWWEYRRAKKAEAELGHVLRELPGTLVDNISRFIAAPDQAKGAKVLDRDGYSSAQYFDLDGDGREELIVQFPTGAHSTGIQIYGFNGHEFTLKAESFSGTSNGFEIDLSDPDISPSLRSIEVSESADLPYVYGLQDVVWSKLEGDRLVQYKRQPPPQDVINECQAMARRDMGDDASAP